MRINPFWAAPVVLPFAMILMARCVWWAAGAAWPSGEGASMIAAFCLLCGAIIGGFFAAVTDVENIGPRICIGRKGEE